MNPLHNVTVIVRSANERTEALCRSLIEAQVPAQNVVTIREVPFSAAVQKTFEVGIERNLPWTLCFDADVLISKGAIKALLQAAETTADHIFEVQGYVLCKFFGGPRPAGNHLYRTSLLPEALRHVPTQNVLRPETAVMRKMESIGHPFIQLSTVVGLHDYEQYYKDIYRKCFIQAHKHSYLMERLFDPLWQRESANEPDFKVAMSGLEDGQVHTDEVKIDVSSFPVQIEALLADADLSERGPIDPQRYGGQRPEQVIKRFIPGPEYIEQYPQRYREFELFQEARVVTWLRRLAGLPGRAGRKLTRVARNARA